MSDEWMMKTIKPQGDRQLPGWFARLSSGALAGMLASIPMGLMMIGLNRALSPQPEPPKQITARLARRAGLAKAVKPGKRWGPATWAGHLGYGAAAASLFPLLTRRIPMPGVIRGMLFALAIWAVSYQGWLPAANIMAPATEQPKRRNLVMIASHLVWGALVGLLGPRIETAEQQLVSRRSM